MSEDNNNTRRGNGNGNGPNSGNGSSLGRGGSPSGFIGRSIVSDMHRDAIEERNGTGQPQPQSTAAAARMQAAESNPESLLAARDLQKSGLTLRDISARVLGTPEKAKCQIPLRGEGYVIPYYNISGEPVPYYRARVLNADFATNGVKYKQPAKTANYIYFPRNFHRTLLDYNARHPSQRILLVTEGEKKAACATKLGFPCVGLGGVDNWRSRTILLPEDTEFYSTQENAGNDGRSGGGAGRKGAIKARLPSSDVSVPELVTLAVGFGDMLDTISLHNLSVVLIYDSDRGGTLKAPVQRAATMLGYELVFLGIHAHRIKQLILPPLPSHTLNGANGHSVDQGGKDANAGASEDEEEGEHKTGLDDFLMEYGPERLQELIAQVLIDPQAFPRHPNPKGFISTQLQNRQSRKSMQQVASMILTELDAGGKRLRDRSTQQPYYYDRHTAHLIPVSLSNPKTAPFHESSFGTLLYQKFGISANDSRVLVWLASQFTGEDPIEETTPRRVHTLITEKEDARPYCQGVAFQAGDSQFFAVTAHPDPREALRVYTNGELGILFEQDQVEPLDVDLVLEHFDHQLEEAKHAGYLESWWTQVLEETTIGLQLQHDIQELEPEDADRNQISDEPDEDGTISVESPTPPEVEVQVSYFLTPEGQVMRTYAALLAYISPFLLRWRGLQLPIEMTVGPAGSGKSSLYSLRLSILTGRPLLRNIPSDIKDWQASLAHVGGLHVTDNVHFLNRELRQRLSDELCRITTEPSPHIEQRKYFTNTDQLRFPVSCVFGFTSIQMPFINEDLIQRSVTFHTEFVEREPEGDWVTQKLEERGGREAWIAHHMVFLHLLLRSEWNDEFHTSHRLAHLEQTLYLAAKVITPPGEETFKRLEAPRRVSPTPTSAPTHERAEAVPTLSKGPANPPFAFQLGRTMLENQAAQIQSSDWVLQGLKAFLEDLNPNPQAVSKRFNAAEIVDFCTSREDFDENEILINSRRLGRYMSEHASTLASVLQIYNAGVAGNRQMYRYIPRRPEPHPERGTDD